MTEHTKEPWQSDMQGTTNDWPSISDARGALIARLYGANERADMRRIVACVNACAGIPTETLERAITLAPRERIMCLEAICAELASEWRQHDPEDA